MSPRKLLKCQHCQAQVMWVRLADRWRLFDARPVDRAAVSRPAYAIENGRTAWRLPDLIPDLQARRSGSYEDAEAEARDMPAHTLHDCPNEPPRTQEDQP